MANDTTNARTSDVGSLFPSHGQILLCPIPRSLYQG
jgi:hypothetical protein